MYYVGILAQMPRKQSPLEALSLSEAMHRSSSAPGKMCDYGVHRSSSVLQMCEYGVSPEIDDDNESIPEEPPQQRPLTYELATDAVVDGTYNKRFYPAFQRAHGRLLFKSITCQLSISVVDWGDMPDLIYIIVFLKPVGMPVPEDILNSKKLHITLVRATLPNLNTGDKETLAAVRKCIVQDWERRMRAILANLWDSPLEVKFQPSPFGTFNFGVDGVLQGLCSTLMEGARWICMGHGAVPAARRDLHISYY
jgi:hypothetical protein